MSTHNPPPHMSPEDAMSLVGKEMNLNEKQFSEFKELVGNIYMMRESISPS